ncbi:MAG TPA: glycogen debranching enzyme, partial [Trebonia sp.]
DNEVSWVDWSKAAGERDLLAFTRRLARLRRDHPVFRRRRFFRGAYAGTGDGALVDGTVDLAWLTPAGDEMTESDWRQSYAKSVAVFLNGSAITEPDPRGDRVTDKKFLLMFNAGDDPITFTIPEARLGHDWEIVLDTETPRGEPPEATGFLPKTKIEVCGHAIVVLRSRT